MISDGGVRCVCQQTETRLARRLPGAAIPKFTYTDIPPPHNKAPRRGASRPWRPSSPLLLLLLPHPAPALAGSGLASARSVAPGVEWGIWDLGWVMYVRRQRDGHTHMSVHIHTIYEERGKTRQNERGKEGEQATAALRHRLCEHELHTHTHTLIHIHTHIYTTEFDRR